ncbi:AraC family transcriptional regulator [Leptolyngbya sp. Heron Island J]|uniref:AraC family transcriptional regulator n=1 Tax=Leptolyngbya sp. Heron Island J TaxID=1385935 RepID=UPI0004102741|nr:AraC family transcriptional regulator [Leptolyngbya sp. Heron Island J]
MLQTIIGEKRTYAAKGCTHDHPFAQLIVPLTGSLFIETQVHQFKLDASSVFFVPPGCSHYFYGQDANEFLILDIPAHLVANLTRNEISHGIRADFEERWHALRLLLLAEIDEQGDAGENASSAASLLHLVHYSSSLLAQSSSSPSLRYIHQQYHRPLSVAQLAQIEGYSFSYYSEWFQGKTGKSPKAYIQDLRLKQAKDLLQHTDLPIYQIAQRVGFGQASSLSRLLRQREGISPKVYRTRSKIRRTYS